MCDVRQRAGHAATAVYCVCDGCDVRKEVSEVSVIRRLGADSPRTADCLSRPSQA